MAKITQSSTAEYFAKNLQQVGFSSPIKAVLTTLKEAVDNSLDACEEGGILPELKIKIQRVGKGSGKNTELVFISIEDNGPGVHSDDLTKVFGEYLASSKFGKGQCSRGQQGIGISAATTWAQLTNATGVRVLNKTASMRKAIKATIDVDIKANKGKLKNKELVEWKKAHGLKVEFIIDGRVQLNGDGGLLTYLEGTILVNPHLSLNYDLLDVKKSVQRVSEVVPKVPLPTLPHPHTMKLGEFLTHSHLYGNMTLQKFLRKGFSRIGDDTIKSFTKKGLPKAYLNKSVHKMSEADFKKIFSFIQEAELKNPTTSSVLTVGEEGLAKSIHRLGEVDFFSVNTRKPRICDFKPVVVEVAIARFLDKRASEEDSAAQLLRFANRVPLQFDKSSCAITRSVESVNWRSYGLAQPKGGLPLGPYVFAVSVTSPFIKFKNASKETIDASSELVEEIRRALMQAGQRLSRHLRRENKAADLERKKKHIEKYGPILIERLVNITKASKQRQKNAEVGLRKILGRDTEGMEEDLESAESRLTELKKKQAKKLGITLENTKGKGPKGQLELSLPLTVSQGAAPKKSVPKKAAPKKSVPKKAAPKKSAPKKAAPKKSAPKKAAPKKSAPKKAALKKAAVKKKSKARAKKK